MIPEKWFKYYTSQHFVAFSGDDGGPYSIEKVDELSDLAEETVKKRKEVLSADKFETNGEYQIYLLAVSECAWAEKLGAVIEKPIID